MLKVKGRKTEMIPKGLLFFPVTPFQTDQSLNLPALKQHLEIGLNYEPGGLFVGCGAGEFHALSENEILAVIKIAVETNKGRVPLYIGAGGQIQVAKNISAKAQDLGADGLLVFPPYMATPSDEGLLRYFDELSCASSLQLIAYNRLGTVLTAELIRGLLNIKTVIGIKDGFGRPLGIARGDLADEERDVDGGGAGHHARRVITEQAAFGCHPRVIARKSWFNVREIVGGLLRAETTGGDAGDRSHGTSSSRLFEAVLPL